MPLLSHSVVSDSLQPCELARQAPLSMRFSRQKYWSELPWPPPGALPDPEIEPTSLTSPALLADSLPLSCRGETWYIAHYVNIQFSSVVQLCLTLCDPMNCSTPSFPVHHQLPELAQTHVHWVSDAIQPSHAPLSPFPAFSLSEHQGLFKWVSSSHQVAKVLELS